MNTQIFGTNYIASAARDEPPPRPPHGWINLNGVEPRATLFGEVEIAAIPYPGPEWVRAQED